MHVLHVNLAFVRAASGADLVDRLPAASRLCEAIAAQPGVRVTHLARFWRDEDLERRGVRYFLRADDPNRLVARPWTRPRALYRLARALHPDVVQIYGLGFPVQAWRFRRAVGAAPIVIQPHGTRVGTGRSWLAQRWMCRSADAIFFTAAEQAAPWRAAGIVPPRFRVFEVADASTDFVPEGTADARARLGAAGEPLVLWVARLHPRKQPLVAFEGFARALDRLPHARLIVIGDGPLRPAIETWLLERPRVAARVALVGALSHDALPSWYSAADVFLTSSPEEGSNWALIEALACGTLPVCTDIAPHRRITGNGRVAELWPVGDADAAAEALVRGARRVSRGTREEESLRTRLRAHFDACLSWDAVARDSLASYRALVDASGTR